MDLFSSLLEPNQYYANDGSQVGYGNIVRRDHTSEYLRTNTSFSGCDITAIVNRPEASPVRLGNLSTITYSIHREKYPVRAVGLTNPKGFTRGPRTIAGTCIFTVLNKHALYELREDKAGTDNDSQKGFEPYNLSDQLVPIDIVIVFTNEMGVLSKMTIYGVEFVDEGMVMSINDIYTESTHSYVAAGIDLMHPGGETMTNAVANRWTDGSFTFNTFYNKLEPTWRPAPRVFF